MSIRYAVDDARGLLLPTLEGSVSGQAFRRFSEDLYGNRPDLFAYATILDLRAYTGDITHADLRPLLDLYAARPGPSRDVCRGLIVTTDPNFHYWASALDARVPGRTHQVVESLEQAFAELA